MTRQTEVELKFLVPRAARTAVLAQVNSVSTGLARTLLAAQYLDTPDRRLARAGLAWRLRREGRHWVQALKAAGASALERFEHEVVRPDASFDAAAHAGTPPGDALVQLLRRAAAEGLAPGVRYGTSVRRTTRRIRSGGAVVELAFDEGRLLAGGRSQRILEIEFELVSGSPQALLALAGRWCQKFGLVHDPRSKAERGDRLADGHAQPPLRKAAPPGYARGGTALQAFCAVLDDCLAQIHHNAIGLIEGDPALRVEHVHQLRVGIRRLRSALRAFRGWVPMPPDGIVQGLRGLFAQLGRARDSDVLDSGVAAALAQAGAPALPAAPGPAAPDPAGPDPAEQLRAWPGQRLLLAWLAWRVALPAAAVAAELAAESASASVTVLAATQAIDTPAGPVPGTAPGAAATAGTLRRDAVRRLRRWHAGLVAEVQRFDQLDEAGLHALRKRIKRQRYAVEFFAPLLRQRQVARYLGALTPAQEQMGALNDLFVARGRYQAQAQSAHDPGAWFALGWLAARITELRGQAGPALQGLAQARPPAA